MASNLHSCTQTPQPVHWVGSTTAFFSRMEMAGQPIFMQDLQPLQLSVITYTGGWGFTVFSRVQGRRAMMTEGSGAASSSVTAFSHWSRL